MLITSWTQLLSARCAMYLSFAGLSIVSCIAYSKPANASELFFDSKSPQARKILFVGNSLTFVNQLPMVLAALVFDSQTATELRIGEAVKGGATLEEMYEHTDAAETIKTSGPWTDIVLQEQSDVMAPEKTYEYAVAFSGLARQARARTIIFETWAHTDKQFDQPRIKQVSEEAARRSGGTLVLAGEAFDLCRRQHPEIALYGDDRHPSQAGTYLAACLFYSKIFGRSPVGLPNDLTLTDQKTNEKLRLFTIAPNVAATLQSVAAQFAR